MLNNSKELNVNDIKEQKVEFTESSSEIIETQKDEILNLDNVCKNIIELIEDNIKEKENSKFTSDEVDFLKIVLSSSPQTCKNLENKINNIIYGDTYY